jgi:hypothetical protein
MSDTGQTAHFVFRRKCTPPRIGQMTGKAIARRQQERRFIPWAVNPLALNTFHPQEIK